MAIDERYRAAIRDLVTSGVLNDEQGAAVESALSAVGPDGAPADPAATPAVAAAPGPAAGRAPVKAGWIAEVAGYLGGGLMLGGLLLVLGASWSSLSRGGRIGVVGLAFALLVGAAIVIAGGRLRALAAAPPSPHRRVVGALLGIAVVPAVPLVGLSLGEARHAWSIACAAGVAVAVTGLWLVPNLFGVIVLAAVSFVAAVVIAADTTDDRGWAGVAVLVVAVAWALAAMAGRVAPRSLALGVAAAFGLIGAQLLYGFADWPAYTVTAAVALACLGLYRLALDPVLVVAAVAGVTVAVPEAISDWTDGGLGAAYIVLLGGAVLVAGSVVALRLRRAR